MAIDLKRFQEIMNEAGSNKAFRKGLRTNMIAGNLRMKRDGTRFATTRMRRRSGMLARSIRSYLRKDKTALPESILQAGGDVSGRGTVKYARIQEEGGDVKPVRGQFLAIPLPGGPAETGAGVARFQSPRDVPDLVFAQTRAKKFALVHSVTGEVWYILRRRPIHIRAKWYLRDAVRAEEARIPIWVEKLFGETVQPGGTV